MIGRFVLALFLLVLFVADRFVKQFALIKSPAPGDDFFYTAALLNKAGPFSLALPNIFLIAVATLALFWLTNLLVDAYQKNQLGKMLGAGLMFIGGFSNCLDRVSAGGVIDVWHLSLGAQLSFNAADVYLVIGLMVLIRFYHQAAQPTS